MNLSFSQIWPERMSELAGQPNYFPQKILKGLPVDKWNKAAYIAYFLGNRNTPYLKTKDYAEALPKLHTIREDKHNRWKSLKKIHFIINPRSKNRFQFAPVVKCVSVQDFEIVYDYYMGEGIPTIIIDGITELTYDPHYLFSEPETCEMVEKIAANDGFLSIKDFFDWFDKDFSGKIIHWTDLKY